MFAKLFGISSTSVSANNSSRSKLRMMQLEDRANPIGPMAYDPLVNPQPGGPDLEPEVEDVPVPLMGASIEELMNYIPNSYSAILD